MLKLFKLLISLLFLAGLGYAFRDYVPFLAPPPCTEPIPYSLGTFDTKFDISEKDFLNALAKAEKIWEKPYGKELFEYVPAGNRRTVRDLKINLIYDYRQQATEKLTNVSNAVDDNRASYDSLKAKFEALKKDYEAKRSDFEARVKEFNRTGYNQTEAEELKKTQADLNKKGEEINALVTAINRLAAKLNLSVEKYNTINEARGESFKEGVYSEEGFKREIDIYEFSTEEKLVRVLAHELGHALHLDHVTDPKAIMYEFNQGNNASLTEADIAELKAKCEGHP